MPFNGGGILSQMQWQQNVLPTMLLGFASQGRNVLVPKHLLEKFAFGFRPKHESSTSLSKASQFLMKDK